MEVRITVSSLVLGGQGPQVRGPVVFDEGIATVKDETIDTVIKTRWGRRSSIVKIHQGTTVDQELAQLAIPHPNIGSTRVVPYSVLV